GVVAIPGDLVRLLWIMGAMLWKDAHLAAVSFVVVPVLALSTIFFRSRIRDVYRRIRQRIARINAYLQEHLLGIKVVKLFVQEDRSAGEFAALNADHLSAELEGVMYESSFSAYVELLGFLSLAI